MLLEASDDERVDITLQEYVHDSLGAFQEASGTETGFADWAAYLQNSMDRIRRRLGGDRHARVSGMLQDATARHAANGDTEGHRAWIAYLLHEYYDGMYEYQLGKKSHRIVFSGTRAEVCDYLRDTYGIGRRKTA